MVVVAAGKKPAGRKRTASKKAVQPWLPGKEKAVHSGSRGFFGQQITGFFPDGQPQGAELFPVGAPLEPEIAKHPLLALKENPGKEAERQQGEQIDQCRLPVVQPVDQPVL